MTFGFFFINLNFKDVYRFAIQNSSKCFTVQINTFFKNKILIRNKFSEVFFFVI